MPYAQFQEPFPERDRVALPVRERRAPDCARNPQASAVNVRNDGAVNSGQDTASSVISDAGGGSPASGNIMDSVPPGGLSSKPACQLRGAFRAA